MRWLCLGLLYWICSGPVWANGPKIVLVTIDGVRWQEVFYGADPALMPTTPTSAAQLMPFFHAVIARKGLMIGDRRQGSRMNVSNRSHISYPGYQELLCGYADPAIQSNQKKHNPNPTVLEFLSQQPALAGKVAAFGSWELLPYILNSDANHLPVNAGYSPMSEQMFGPLTEKVRWLNQLQRQTPSPWPAVRFDTFTMQFALNYLQRHRPHVLYIALGEPDDYAHAGDYPRYLAALQRADQYLAELWQTLQQDPYYRGETTLLITTDHGRGDHASTWARHGAVRALPGLLRSLTPEAVTGSDEIWFAAMGPHIPATGLLRQSETFWQNQVASTMAQLLGYDFVRYQYRAAQALALGTEPLEKPLTRQSP